MSINYVVEIPSARACRVFHAASVDLRTALNFIELVTSEECEERTSLEEEAAWTAAVIRFVRGWKSGSVTESARREVSALLTPAQKKALTHILTIRAAMYAHQGGVGTDYTVTALVGKNPSGATTLYGVGIQSNRISSPGTALAEQVREILTLAIPVFARHENYALDLVRSDLEKAPADIWMKGGVYRRELHYDETSKVYRDASKKRSLPPD